jgi:hypothetical protein
MAPDNVVGPHSRTGAIATANAKVVYELPNSAMGLAFEEVSLKSGEILRQWLLKASGGSERL